MVPDELVHHVRLRRVERPAGVPDVLRAEENLWPTSRETGETREKSRKGCQNAIDDGRKTIMCVCEVKRMQKLPSSIVAQTHLESQRVEEVAGREKT